MKTTHVHKGVTWIDLECPTIEEVRDLTKQYDIDPLAAQELIAPSSRPKVDLYPHFIYLILHFPELTGLERSEGSEIDFIIGQNYIITAHYETIEYFQELKKTLEVDEILGRGVNMINGDHAGYIFFFMMRGLYRAVSYEVEYLRNVIVEIERKVFHDQERAMVIEISKLNRTLLSFKEALGMHKEVLASFEGASKKFFGPDFDYHTRDIIGEYTKAESAVISNKEYLKELRDTNDSLLNTKQNDIMKTLTVMSFFILPATLITGIFGMNARDLPIIGDPYDFEIIVGIILVMTLIIYISFRVKGWLK